MNQNVTLAVAKGGRILSAQLELLAKIGVEPLDDMKTSRKLIFDTNRENLQLVLLRGADVATYVEHGIADLGMTGKDSLLEHGEEGYYQPLDLKIGQCSIMVAGLRDEPPLPSRLKIATKYEKTAKQFYAEKGIKYLQGKNITHYSTDLADDKLLPALQMIQKRLKRTEDSAMYIGVTEDDEYLVYVKLGKDSIR